jgi:leucyl-tRNA synthetase
MIRLNGTKMSKSKGNLVSPEEYYETVGADGLRLFHLFVGPPADNVDWTDQTEEVIDGLRKVPRPRLPTQPVRRGQLPRGV